MEQLAAYRKKQADRHKQAQEQHERDKAKWIQVLKDIPLLTAAFEENGCIKVGASETLRMATPKLMQQLEELGTLMESKEFAWWKSDKEFVLAAVAASGDALEEVSEELKNDKEVVMIAVAQNSSALAYASNELQKDSDVLALIENGHTFGEEKAAMIQVMNEMALLAAEVMAVGGDIDNPDSISEDDKTRWEKIGAELEKLGDYVESDECIALCKSNKDFAFITTFLENSDDMNMPPKDDVDEKQGKKRNMKDDGEQAPKKQRQ